MSAIHAPMFSGEETDPYWSDVILLVNFDDPDNYADRSGTQTITNSGTTLDVSGQFGKCGKYGGALTFPATSALDYSGVFTIEFWIKVDATPSGSLLGYADIANGWNISTSRELAMNTSNSTASAGILSASTWHFIAYCQDGSNKSLYVDGTRVYSGSGAISSTGYYLNFDFFKGTNNGIASGVYLDDVRYTKVRRYPDSATCPVPTKRFPTS